VPEPAIYEVRAIGVKLLAEPWIQSLRLLRAQRDRPEQCQTYGRTRGRPYRGALSVGFRFDIRSSCREIGRGSCFIQLGSQFVRLLDQGGYDLRVRT
jgi:hypothetical protein